MAYKIRLSPIKRPDAPKVVPLVNAAEVPIAPPIAAGSVAVPVPTQRPSVFGVPSSPKLAALAQPMPARPSMPTPMAAPIAVPVPTQRPAVFGIKSAPPPSTMASPAASEAANEAQGPGPTPIADAPAPTADFVLPTAPVRASKPMGEAPVSTATSNHSAAPARVRAIAVIVKWTLLTALALAGAYGAITYLKPIIIELQRPKGSAPVAIDKEASTVVKALQQTKMVTAKKEEQAAYLNSIIAELEPKAPEVKPPPPVVVRPPEPMVVPRAPDRTMYEQALIQMKVDGVTGGPTPRAYIDGRLFKFGDIVDRQLGLRFVGVDLDEHVVLFTNADNETFRKRY